jgi:AraC-like DNA-binding protein
MNSGAEGLLHVFFGRFREVRDSPRYRWDNARRGSDPFIIMQLTRRGEGVFEVEGRAHRVPAGHAFIAVMPEDSAYYYPETATKPWVFSWLNFHGELALELWGGLRHQAGPVIPLSPRAVRLFYRLAARAEKRRRPDSYATSRAAYELYLETLRHLPRPKTARPLQEAVSYFHAHYREPVRMKEVAARIGMSREHFTRLFTREMKFGPAEFLRGIRLEVAARLLRTTDLPVAEAAFRSGWAAATKLDYFFKRRYGVSPREYRRKGKFRTED